MDKNPEITITVHGAVGIGKSTVVLSIIDMLRGHGLACAWADEVEERGLGVPSDDVAYLERKPTVRLLETNPAMIGRDPIDQVLAMVRAELARATRKFPTWPDDPLHAVAVVAEESGELTRAVLQAVYEPHKGDPQDAMDEAVQTAAMAVRFLLSRSRYTWRKGIQHTQAFIGSGELAGDGTGEALPDFAQLPRIAPPVDPAAVEDDEEAGERCESGLPRCGPAVAWDTEGVGVCAICAAELAAESDEN